MNFILSFLYYFSFIKHVLWLQNLNKWLLYYTHYNNLRTFPLVSLF